MYVEVSISRTELALPDLDINDGVNYKLSSEVSMGVTSWRRERVSSPYVEGQFTINRVRDSVDTTLAVEVFGANPDDIRTKVAEVIQAFSQDLFFLTIRLGTGSAYYKYECEAADYGLNWSTERHHANQALVAFQFPRHPNPILGPV